MILDSLSDTLRMCREDITEAAKPSIEAEDMRKSGARVKVPRYASYSVWVCSTVCIDLWADMDANLATSVH